MRLRASVALLCFASFFLASALPAVADEGTTTSGSVTAQGTRRGKPTLMTKPVPIGNGYSIFLETWLTQIGVVIRKTDADSSQYYTWAFARPGGVSSNDSLSVVTVNSTLTSDADTGASGTISLKSNKKLPGDPVSMSGCKGVKYETRGGTLNGNFSFETGIDLFGKIELSSLPLKYARRTVGPTRCTPPPADCERVWYSVFLTDVEYGTIFAERSGSSATIEARFVEYYPDGWTTKVLNEKTDADHLQVSTDLLTGSLQGSGAIVGSLAHEANGPLSEWDGGECGTVESSGAVVSGGMTLEFDTGTVEASFEANSGLSRYKS